MISLRVLGRVNWWVALVAVALAMVGWLFIRSATFDDPDPRIRLLYIKHGVVLAVAAASGLVLLLVPYRKIMRHAWLIYAVVLVSLLLLPVFGVTINGARRWYRFPGFGVQPAEFAKLGVILAVASYLRFRVKARTADGLLVPLLITAVPALLVLRQPDLGSALVFGPVLLAVCFVAGAPSRSLLGLLAIGAVGLGLWYFKLHDYQLARVDVWLSHFGWDPVAAETDPEVRQALRGHGYQPWQALIAMGSGGLLGFGLEQGPQNRYDFLPYRFDDYIFAVVAEETGFVGACALLVLHLLLVIGLFFIALRTRERFGRLLVVGIAAYFATQTLVHAAVCCWLIPATGLPMPLVSYGGSSTLVSVWALALALNVSARREPVFASDGFA